MAILTVKELIKKLKKLPEDHEIHISVDDSYTSYITKVHVDQYEKRHGKKVVTIEV